MPIELYTGKPGNGKTALMMERLMSEAKSGKRPLFAAGIDGLQPGLATVLKDPTQWNALKPGHSCTCHDTEDDAPCDAHVVPNGSLIFFDEAWKWFGHLHDASRQATPKHVLELAEHRHRGIDMVWTSQGPNQIYPFARPLIADHRHTVRKFGTSMIEVFHWQELQEDVKSSAKRELAQSTTRTLPSTTYGAYKSAEVHTIKPKIPLKVLMIPVLLVAAIVLGWIGYTYLRPSAFSGTINADKQGPNAASAASAPGVSASEAASASGRRDPKWKDQTDYARDHLARFATMPWTAPAFDGREVTADPQLMCMSGQAGQDANGQHKEASCTCFTEQGTPYDMSQPECRRVARRGAPYNPYRERGREQRWAGLEQPQRVAQSPSQPYQAGQVITAGSPPSIGQVARGAEQFSRSPGYDAAPHF